MEEFYEEYLKWLDPQQFRCLMMVASKYILWRWIRAKTLSLEAQAVEARQLLQEMVQFEIIMQQLVDPQFPDEDPSLDHVKRRKAIREILKSFGVESDVLVAAEVINIQLSDQS